MQINIAWFRKKMKEVGLKQVGIAERIGIHASSLSKILQGKQTMTISQAYYLSRALNTCIIELLANMGLEMKHSQGCACSRHGLQIGIKSDA
jgi:plasmid maintenance system antidote protein VapI